MTLKNDLANARTFAELAPIARQMQTEISTLGWRYIYVPGRGKIDINAFHPRLDAIARISSGILSNEERDVAFELVGIAKRLYRESDEKFIQSRGIKHFLCRIREIFERFCHSGFTIRHLWEGSIDEDEEEIYDAMPPILCDFTREQYERQFGHPPRERPSSDNSFEYITNSPLRRILAGCEENDEGEPCSSCKGTGKSLEDLVDRLGPYDTSFRRNGLELFHRQVYIKR